jgi:hypothetical protein
MKVTFEKDLTWFGLGFAVLGLFKKEENTLVQITFAVWSLTIY